jgi:hypothetical protein
MAPQISRLTRGGQGIEVLGERECERKADWDANEAEA